MALIHNSNSICIIIPYFGEKPKWIPYFLKSCEANSTIIWKIFTDWELNFNYPANIEVIPFTLKSFNDLASKKVQTRINVENGYKICDFKPLYGKIFEDYIKEFKFWGYGDLDLIYGNIRQFIADERLNKNDIISMHKNFVTGHFCILRNSDTIINLYKQSPILEEVLSSKNYYGFDEQLLLKSLNTDIKHINKEKEKIIRKDFFLEKTKNFIKRYTLLYLVIKKLAPKKKSPVAKDFTDIVKRNTNQGIIKAEFSTLFECDLMLKKREIDNWEIKWDKGELKNQATNQEILYFHFMLSKDETDFIIEEYSGKNEFIITPKGIKNGI